MSCTVVTAFYPIRSKFPSRQYVEWASTFLQIDAPVVLFTEESLVTTFASLRGNRPIHIIVLPFEELDTWKLYGDKWKEQHAIDPEHVYHTPELYAIWAQKAFFVKRAIQVNPFHTTHFFWCDIGAFRNPGISTRILETFPRTHYFVEDKILFQSMGRLEETDKEMKEDGIPGPMLNHAWNNDRLVGGLWGGNIHACLQWKRHYQDMLERYFEKGRFAGKDQVVMLSTYLESPELAMIVQPTRSDMDQWFFLEYLLSDTNTRLEMDPSYSM